MKLNIGQLVGRLEDTRFITGSGCYTDDEGVGGGLRDAFLRATRAHARLRSIDYRVAETAPRGRLVPSKADLDADQIDEFRCQVQFENYDGNKTPMTTMPAIVRDYNRNADDIVAVVVADTQTEADDSVELIYTSFNRLSAVSDFYAAMADGAPQAVIAALFEASGIGHADMPVTSQKIYDILSNKQVDSEAG